MELVEQNLQELSAHRERIEAALRYDDDGYSFADVEEEVRTGRLQVWAAPRAVMVTRIVEAPKLKSLHVFLAAGDMKQLAQIEPIVMEWGRVVGCQQASFLGRRGWARTFLARVGWKPSLVWFSKSLL